MKIRPEKILKEAGYPSRCDYSVARNSELLKLLTAVGISISTIVTPNLAADEKPQNGRVSDSVDKINLEIAKLVASLGNQDYQTRENATVALIAIGNSKIKDKNGKEACNTKVKDAVISAMDKLKKDRDPEVKQRAKRVILALNPPKCGNTGNDIPMLGGVMIAPQDE